MAKEAFGSYSSTNLATENVIKNINCTKKRTLTQTQELKQIEKAFSFKIIFSRQRQISRSYSGVSQQHITTNIRNCGLFK